MRKRQYKMNEKKVPALRSTTGSRILTTTEPATATMPRTEHRSGFDYIVNPPVIPRVAFGSSLERVTLPLNGPCLSPFMRRVQGGEVRPRPGPSDYAVAKGMELKYPSKLGYSALVSKIPRLPATSPSVSPPIGAYDIELKRNLQQAPKPFGVGMHEMPVHFTSPGPPTYPHHISYVKMPVTTAFGSKRITRPAVAVFCAVHNTAKCIDCGQTPHGDYWHNFQANVDKCRPCMKKDLQQGRSCSTDVFNRIRKNRELSKFKPARYCGFFHDHNGTTAATQLISWRTLRFKIEKENYLFGFESNGRL